MRLSLSLRVLLLLLSLCLLSLTACAPGAGRNPFAYAEAPFSLWVEGTYLPANDPLGTPRPFVAEVRVGAPRNGDPTRRDLTVTFTSPASLAGVTVTATLSPTPEGGMHRRVEMTYPSSYGTIRTTSTGEELNGFLRFAEGWLPLGDVAEASPKTADGSYTVTRRSGDREMVFTFAAGRDLPVGVRLTDRYGVVDMYAK